MGRPQHQYRHRAHRGMAYVVVLMTAVLISTIGLAAVLNARVTRRTAQQTDDHIRARLFAQSAIEFGFARIGSSSSWRTAHGAGRWLDDLSWEEGTLTLEVQPGVDDGWVLTGIGVVGETDHRIEVIVIPDGQETIVSAGTWKRVLPPP